MPWAMACQMSSTVRAAVFLRKALSFEKAIVLNQAAQDLLANLPRVEGNPYVIV